MPPLIAHLDADCFYVSAERVRYPFLIHQPVGVLGNQGACVIAKSYELKKHGITTGMPIWEAVKLSPDAIFVKRDFRWYEVLSRKLLEIIGEVSPVVEYYSIDEMFFDASHIKEPHLEAIRMLQNRILHEIGVPVSIGLSFNKTLAKLISDSSKPFGCGVLTDKESIPEFIGKQPIGEVSGIGRKSQEKLAALGIHTCLDFARADRLMIRDILTITGEALWWELNGDFIKKIVTSRPPHKFIGRGGSIGGASNDDEIIWAWAVRNTERLIETLNYHNVFAGRIHFSLEFQNGGGWGGRMPFSTPTAKFAVILKVIRHMFRMGRVNHQAVSGMHILADRLTYQTSHQMNLFIGEEIRNDKISELKQLVNSSVGRFALRSGETLALTEIYDDPSHSYDICDIQGKMCF
ncbi:DNA polymerase Y family protein [Planctomicrobium sp. SH527]|uniref:DNA polymerase Y family protein n=1 Tax=Planctomicrobium sp. SH527 TaxID=3448123 RepID=UPI003F5BDA49